MVLLYATADDLQDFLDEPAPDNVDRLLRSASSLVRTATRAALYDVTSAGLPSDSDVAGAFRDATCAQAAAWITMGIDPTAGAGAVQTAATTSSIGSASVTVAARAGQDEARAATITELVPDAIAYLAAEGLLAGGVTTY